MISADCAGDNEVLIAVTGHWKRIFDEQNNSSTALQYSRRLTHGMRTKETDGRTVRAGHTIEGSISTGDLLQVAEITIGYKMENSVERTSIREAEIERMSDVTVMFVVPAWTRLVRWQLMIDIVGNEFGSDQTVTTNDDTVPEVLNVTARVRLRRMIRWDRTPVRIKHVASDKYVTMVMRNGWQAPTLGQSSRFHFTLHDSGIYGIRIKTENSTFPGYHYLYTWLGRWVYTDKYRGYRDCKRLYWFPSRSPPLYDGDVMSFMSKAYDNSYLCYDDGDAASNVACVKNREEEWILEAV